jgi:hypothetical protein
MAVMTAATIGTRPGRRRGRRHPSAGACREPVAGTAHGPATFDPQAWNRTFAPQAWSTTFAQVTALISGGRTALADRCQMIMKVNLFGG